jgi:hypothetical protein
MTKSEERIEFWINMWESFIKNFLKKPSFGLNLYNPHILIEDIISEIEDNSFKNSDNKKYFYSKLNYYIENDPVIKKDLSSMFQIARRNFEPNKSNYLLEILKQIKLSFSNGFYFEKCLDLLIYLLTNNNEITEDFIKESNYLSQVMIIEFVKRKYSLEDIVNFPKQIFEGYEYEEDGRLVTNFPHGLDPNDYDTIDNKTEPKFYEDVKQIMDSLTNFKRLKALLNLFNKKTRKVYYIFVVEGLKGSDNIDIAGVTFYSLDKKRYTEIPENPDFDEENLQMIKKESYKFLQAAVEVDYLTSKSSLLIALSKLETALDLISCFYSVQTPLVVNSSNYLVVEDNKCINWFSGTDKREKIHKHIDSIDVKDLNIYLDIILEKDIQWNDFNDKSVRKIKNAIHWHRKAQESNNDEDKLLNYWISIENLFTESNLSEILNKSKSEKINIIKEVISSNQIFNFIYGYGWDLFFHYYNQFQNLFQSHYLSMPDELIERANFNKKNEDVINLKEFINCIGEIKLYETNPFLFEQLRQIEAFYNNAKEAKTIIENQIEQIQNDLLMIYRFRNLIVHNAHFDNTLLKYYVWKINQFSNNFLKSIIKNLDKEKTLEDIIFSIQTKKEHFFNEIDSGRFEIFER